MHVIGEMISGVIKNRDKDKIIRDIKEKVIKLVHGFPVYSNMEL